MKHSICTPLLCICTEFFCVYGHATEKMNFRTKPEFFHSTPTNILFLQFQVLYSFSPSTSTAHQSIFNLNNITGDILLLGKLDREQESIYHLTVTASDKGVGSIPAEATVVVHVLDVNEHAPQVCQHLRFRHFECRITVNFFFFFCSYLSFQCFKFHGDFILN